MTALQRLATAIADPAPLSPAVRSVLALRAVDITAAWIAGIGTAEGRALIGFRRNRPDGAPYDLMLNCALARLSEIDDIHLASTTTPGAIVIPGALTLARAYGCETDLEPAIAAGYEAMIRFGLAIRGSSVLFRGIWPTYFGASFGIAAVAARLFKFDAETTAHALALALTTAAPGVGHHNAVTTSRWLAVGLAARTGLDAALAAQAGITSDLALLDGHFLSGVYDIQPDLAAFDGDLGVRPALLDLSFKPWCAARQTMAATQALKNVVAAGVALPDIASITAYVVPAHLKMIDHGVVAGDRASHLTSLPYQMAVAVLDPAAADVAQSPAAVSAAVRDLMNRISVAGDADLAVGYPKLWPARVRVTTSSGRVEERSIERVPGDPGCDFDAAAVAGKFGRFVAPVAGPERVAEFEHLARRLEPASLLAALDNLCRRNSCGGDGIHVDTTSARYDPNP